MSVTLRHGDPIETGNSDTVTLLWEFSRLRVWVEGKIMTIQILGHLKYDI